MDTTKAASHGFSLILMDSHGLRQLEAIYHPSCHFFHNRFLPLILFHDYDIWLCLDTTKSSFECDQPWIYSHSNVMNHGSIAILM